MVDARRPIQNSRPTTEIDAAQHKSGWPAPVARPRLRKRDRRSSAPGPSISIRPGPLKVIGEARRASLVTHEAWRRERWPNEPKFRFSQSKNMDSGEAWQNHRNVAFDGPTTDRYGGTLGLPATNSAFTFAITSETVSRQHHSSYSALTSYSKSLDVVIDHLKVNTNLRDFTLELGKAHCSRYPIATGGLADVYSATLSDGSIVAIKRMRSACIVEGKTTKVCCLVYTFCSALLICRI